VRAIAPHDVEVCCSDVHPFGCRERLHARCPRALVARACEHGVHVHGCTPAWYSPQRVALITAAVTRRCG
jgi:hypothetical protein